MSQKHIVGIMSSGPGMASTCRYILQAIADGRLGNAQLGAAIGSEANAGVLQMAVEAGIPHRHISKQTHGSGEAAEAAMLEIFREQGVELVLLVGYRKKVGAVLLEAFLNRILNLHPAPIPRFGGQGLGGIMAQRAVLEAGVAYTGPVVHIVDAEYDHGPVLGYWPIKVQPGETAESLEQRCNEAGWELWVRTLSNVLGWLDHPKDF